MSVRPLALRAIVLGTLGIAVAYASAFLPPPWSVAGAWLMAMAVPLVLMATMSLGAQRAHNGPRHDTPPDVGERGALGRLRWPFLFVFLLVTGGFLVALGLPVEAADTPLLLGLPPRAAVILYGVGVLPLFILPVVYLRTFDSGTLSDDAIARVRAARRSGSAAVPPA
jgi:hypothetical protein